MVFGFGRKDNDEEGPLGGFPGGAFIVEQGVVNGERGKIAIRAIGPGGKFVTISADQMPSFIVSGLISGMFGEGMLGRGYNFVSAHYDRNSGGHIPLSEVKRISEEIEKIRGLENPGPIFVKGFPTYEKVLTDILRTETTLDLDKYHMHALQRIGTRGSIQKVIGSFPSGKSICLPLPNWHFWDMPGNHSFDYFLAKDEAELVSGFKEKAKKGKIGSLILVDPSNPLGYRISESAAKEIDRVAVHNGVEVIVDDVLRGTMPLGQRDSIARWFSAPYVVEGFGKRFGDEIFGDFSYVLSPKSKNGSTTFGETANADCIHGKTLELAYRFNNADIVSDLEDRNLVLDTTLERVCPEMQVTRPFRPSLISTIDLPMKNKVTALELSQKLDRETEVGIAPLENYFYPRVAVDRRENRQFLYTFRVTVGNMERERIAEGAKILGETYKEMVGNN